MSASLPSFPFLGDIVNATAVVAGSLLGVLLGRFVSGRMQTALMQATGLGTALIGLAGTMAQMLAGASDGAGGFSLASQGSMLLVVSLVLGTLAGQALDIEGKLEFFGGWLREKVVRGRQGGHADRGGALAAGGDGAPRGTTDAGRFNEAFISGALVVCPGAMAVLGALQDGMGDPQTLFVKAALDFVIIFTFASSLGVGTAFAAVPLFVYQGVIVVVGMLAGNVMTPAMTSGLSMVGNAMIFAVGVNLMLRHTLGEHKIPAGNMIPAMLVPVVYALVTGA